MHHMSNIFISLPYHLMLTLTTAANGEAGPFRQKRQASRRMTHHPSACLSKSEAPVPGGRRRSQTEKTSKQTMNDLLACLWELWHNNGMNITNLPPMGNAERGITYPFSMGTYFGTSLFFDPVLTPGLLALCPR